MKHTEESIRTELLLTYLEAREAHARITNRMAYVEEEIKKINPALIVDAVFVLKHANKFIDETRKEIDRKIGLAEKIGCTIVAGSSENRLQGKWATGHGSAREQPGVPHPEREPEEYNALMIALGAPPELVASKTMRPSFDAIGAYMESLGAEGKPVPDALKSVRMIPKYSVSARASKAHILDQMADELQNSMDRSSG